LTIENVMAPNEYEAMLLNQRDHAMGLILKEPVSPLGRGDGIRNTSGGGIGQAFLPGGGMESIHHRGTEAQRDGAATKRSSQKETKETKTGWSFAKNAEFSDIAGQRGQAALPEKGRERAVAADDSASRPYQNGGDDTLKAILLLLPSSLKLWRTGARGEGMESIHHRGTEAQMGQASLPGEGIERLVLRTPEPGVPTGRG
jgi:hypothetical protein